VDAAKIASVIPAQAGILLVQSKICSSLGNSSPQKEDKKLKTGFVYILSNRPEGTLYTGVTSNLIQRIHQHKTHVMPGFSNKYNTTLLVWYECHDEIESAIIRENTLKSGIKIGKYA